METLSKRRETFLESIIHAAPIAIIAVDKELRTTFINPRGIKYLGISEKEQDSAIGKSIIGFLARFGESAASVENQLLTYSYNFDIPEVKLGERYLNVRCRPVLDGALMTFLNINNLKEKETMVLHSIMEGQELERKRFAQDIHDGIGPLLSTLKMGLEGLQQNENTGDIQEIKREAKRLENLLDIISSDVRTISHALLPPTLVDYGLESALSNLCTLVQSQGKIPINLFISKNNTRLNPATELGLYRIAQELLNNAIKHANTNTIAVQLIKHTKSVVLMVEDDGIGFNTDDASQKNGIGLKNIITRVESLGGTFSLESTKGEGVLATIEVPLEVSDKQTLVS
ncbi:MAG: sensor histidine kinase [Saprospiraceae bacterium]|nr:sensor histidine kinase [Saprospiraceae bacterium]